jgi:hypothetical protein
VWRLLVIDSFSGHGGFAFRESCNKFNILVTFLLPYSTHILQPMAGGVFQPMKNAHQKKLREALRKGNLTFNRRDFAGAFQVCLIDQPSPKYPSFHILIGPKSGDLQ